MYLGNNLSSSFVIQEPSVMTCFFPTVSTVTPGPLREEWGGRERQRSHFVHGTLQLQIPKVNIKKRQKSGLLNVFTIFCVFVHDREWSSRK